MVTVKYMFIVLSADDDGEGGTFALYTLLARYANIVRRDPNINGTVHMERYLTGELKPTAKNLRYFIEHNKIARNALKVIGVLGVTMVMAGTCRCLQHHSPMWSCFNTFICPGFQSINEFNLLPKYLQTDHFHRWCFDSCPIGTWCDPGTYSCFIQHNNFNHHRSFMRNPDSSFPCTTIWNHKGSFRMGTYCYYLAAVQLLYWHLQSSHVRPFST